MELPVKDPRSPRLGVMLIAILVVAAIGFIVNDGTAKYWKPLIGKDSAGRWGGARTDRGASAHLSR